MTEIWRKSSKAGVGRGASGASVTLCTLLGIVREYTAKMRKSALVCFMMLSGSLAFGQLDSNSITVSASRSTSLQPDLAVFAVTVQSGLSTSLADVIAALQGSGITQANFAGV